MSLDPSDVSAVLVTKGDVDLEPIIRALPSEYELVIWDNSLRPHDYRVFGRYMGILEATRPVIYVQDDDCVVRNHAQLLAEYQPGVLVGNMRNDPARMRFYHDTTMLGWGALFDRDLPWLAFMRFARLYPLDWEWMTGCGAEITFPMLTPTVTIPVEPEWLQQDGAMVFGRSDRMSNQPGFYEKRDEDLRRARRVRNELRLEVSHRVLAAA